MVVGLSRKCEQVGARWMLWTASKVVSFGPWKVDVLDLHRWKVRISELWIPMWVGR